MTLLTAEALARVGAAVSYAAPEPLGRASIRYFALAVGDDNPLYHDDAYAREHGWPGVIAPPTFVCETLQYAAGRRRDANGYLGHDWGLTFAEPVTMIRGGHDYRFFQAVTPDDVLHVTWTLRSLEEKRGGDGAPMVVGVAEASCSNQHGELLAVNEETLIWRRR
ncbi:MAG: MaoC family dehydratase [Acidimicrobiales bacterium]